MPGVASLRAAQYYAHPRNAFWPVLFALWGARPDGVDYAGRVGFALRHRVAIWDVAHTCLREGSSDASIRNAIPNDIDALLQTCPDIHTVFFNGRQAQAMFQRFHPGLRGRRALALLPSTSPAYTLPFDEKLAAWRAVREAAEQEIAP